MPPAASPPAGLESLQASIEGLRAVVVALAASRGASAGGGAKSKSGGGTGDANDRLEALHTEASLLFLDLRAANRATLESVDASREAAREAKRALDDQRLLLQNVQYEKGHVRKEIRTSSEFVSEFPDEKVGLCDAETFFAEMATNMMGSSDEKRDVTEENEEQNDSVESLRALDPHALTLKRLAHELRRREALVRRRDALEQKKTALTRTNAADRLFLDGLRGELGALRTAVEPLRVKLSSGNRRDDASSDGFFADKFRDVRAAEILRDASLPPPLYVLFAALVGVAERRGLEKSLEKMKMVVSFETGGEDEAAEAGDLPRSRRSRRAPEKNDEDDEDPDAPSRFSRDGGRKRKRAPSHDEGAEAMDGKDFGKNKQRAQTKETETTASTRIVPAPGAHEAHETRVVLRLGADEDGGSIQFRYFPSLRVVTAEVLGSSSHVRERTLLVDLFPGDDGTRAPSASVAGTRACANHGESVSRKDETAFLSHEWDIGGSRRDRPFLWCQHLAGLDPLPLAPPLSPEARARLSGSEAEKSLFSDAAAAERAVAAHAEQRRGATVVAALEARFIDAASLERGVRRVAAAAEAKLGVSGLEGLEADALSGGDAETPAAEPEVSGDGGVFGNARAFLTSFRETFGEDAETSDEGDGGCFRWSGSPVAARLAATGDAAAVASRGARRFAARVEVSNRPFGAASQSPIAARRAGGARAQSAFRDERTTRYLRFAIETPASFPTRPASVALAVRVTSATVDDATNRPPPSPADADAEPSFENELGAFANDARLAEAAANRVESEASTEASRERPDAGAALVRCVARILRAAETYFPPLGAGGAAEDHGTRRGRERRIA
jgi:THO complex subunit 5